MSIYNNNYQPPQPSNKQQHPQLSPTTPNNNHHYNIMINNSFNNQHHPLNPSNNTNGSSSGSNTSPPHTNNTPPTLPVMNPLAFFPQPANIPMMNSLHQQLPQPSQQPPSTINPSLLGNNNSLYEQLLLQEQLFSAFLHNYYQYQRMMMEQQNLHSLYNQQANQTPNSTIGNVQHHSQPPLLVNTSASNSQQQLINQNVQPAGMTSVAIPEPLYEIYIRPILENLQQNLYKGNEIPMAASSSIVQQPTQHDNNAIFLSPSDVTQHPTNISTNSNDNQQSFLESLLASTDEQHLPPVDTMLLYSNHQLDADKEEEKNPNSPQPHKAYDPKKNKKGLKKKRKYIKSGLFKKDRDGNFLISSNDRARLAQFGTNVPRPEEGEEHATLNGEDEHHFYEEEEEEEEDDHTQAIIDSSNSAMTQDHNNIMNSINIHDLLGGHDAHGLLMDVPNESTPARFTEEQSQMGFEWYFAEQFQNFPSANDFFQQEEERSQMRIFVWAQWQLLHDSEKQHYIEIALASQREMLQQVNQVSSGLIGSSSSENLVLSNHEEASPIQVQKMEASVKSEDEEEHINEENLKELDKNVTANRVKKPLSGYNSFVKSVFPSFQEMYPNIDKKQITKLIGQKWKAMPDDEKQPYIEMARQAQPIVKKPLNAYNIYCKEKYSVFKEENPELAPNEVSRMVASSWKKATKEEKQKYYDLAEKWKQESEEIISSTVEKQIKQKSKKRKI